MLKRFLTFLLFGVLLFSFVGCDTFENVSPNNSESAENATTEDSSNTQEDSKTVYFNSLQETGLFEFSYNAEETVWKRGEEISFRCDMEYVGESSLPYDGPSYSSQMPDIIVYQNEDGSVVLNEKSFEIYRIGEIDATTDVLSELSTGFSSSVVHCMDVLEDAPVGKYHLILIFGKHCKIFENAIEIVE